MFFDILITCIRTIIIPFAAVNYYIIFPLCHPGKRMHSVLLKSSHLELIDHILDILCKLKFDPTSPHGEWATRQYILDKLHDEYHYVNLKVIFLLDPLLNAHRAKLIRKKDNIYYDKKVEVHKVRVLENELFLWSFRDKRRGKKIKIPRTAARIHPISAMNG